MDLIDWGAINWLNVIIFAALAFVAALLANFINMIFDGNPITGAMFTGLFFAIVYIIWTHYPHGIDLGQQMQETQQPTMQAPAMPGPAIN